MGPINRKAQCRNLEKGLGKYPIDDSGALILKYCTVINTLMVWKMTNIDKHRHS